MTIDEKNAYIAGLQYAMGTMGSVAGAAEMSATKIVASPNASETQKVVAKACGDAIQRALDTVQVLLKERMAELGERHD